MNTFDGYIRRNGTNSKVLLDGGNAKALSEFIGTISYANNKITYTKADGTSYDLINLSNYIYNLRAATSDNLGGIKIGFSQSGKNYPVQLDSNNKAYVYVPWEENSHYTTRLYVGDGTAENKITTNGNTRITVTDNNNVRNYITLIGSGATNISSDDNGKITINSTNTTYNTGDSATLNKGTNTEGKLWSAKTLVDYISDILGVDSTAITSLNTLIGQLHDNDTATGILVELAKKLNTPSSSIGSNNQPIYWNGSSFTTIGYTIEKSVPSSAVFTDTKYSFYVGENNNIKEHKNVSNPYFKLFENNTPTSIQIKAGTGISINSDANGNITIKNESPDQNHNTDKTGIKLGTISGTKKTDSTVIINNSSTGLTIAGGTNKFSIGDGTNYIEVPITPSFTVSNKDSTIGTSLTTIATIAGIDIKAKIGSYLPLSGGIMTGDIVLHDDVAVIYSANFINYFRMPFRIQDGNYFTGINFYNSNGNIFTKLGIFTDKYGKGNDTNSIFLYPNSAPKIGTNTIYHSGNLSVSKSGETLTVNIGGTSQSLTNTWRGIQNNLTSNSTIDSLSAAQGKILNDKFGNYHPLNGKITIAGGAYSWSNIQQYNSSNANPSYYKPSCAIININSYTGWQPWIRCVDNENGSWALGQYQNFVTLIRFTKDNTSNVQGTYNWTFNADGSFTASKFIGTLQGNCTGSAGSVAWGNVSGKPTTLSGYGITDALNKLTYEYNKEISFQETGENLLIGKFPCSDSNVTIYFDLTTNIAYHATIILATQNINTSHGGTINFSVYGDENNMITPNLYLYYPSDSKYIEVYFSPFQYYSKIIVHIKCTYLPGAPTNICEKISKIPSTGTKKPTNVLLSNYLPLSGGTVLGTTTFKTDSYGTQLEIYRNTNNGNPSIKFNNSNSITNRSIGFETSRNGDNAFYFTDDNATNKYYVASEEYVNDLYNTLLNGYADSAGYAEYSHKLDIHGYSSNGLSFHQTSGSFDGSSESWAHYIIANHGNGESYYHYTIRLPFWSIPQYRRQTGSTSNVTQWYNFITEENISSQSVNYATYANYLNLVNTGEIRFNNKPSSSIEVYFNYLWAGGIADDKINNYHFMNGNRGYAGIVAEQLSCTDGYIYLHGSGSGTYNLSSIFSNSSGLTIETPRATNDPNGTVLPLMVKTRGGQWSELQIGTIVANGNVTATAFYASSDFRLKNILTHPNYSAEQLASLPLIKYTWKDKENDSVHLGSIAQNVEEDFAELVNTDNKGYKSLDYATLGTIGVISLAREIVELKKEIKELKSKLYG